jgi:hypothetical protein
MARRPCRWLVILRFLAYLHDLLVHSISLGLVSIESHNGELLIKGISFIQRRL